MKIEERKVGRALVVKPNGPLVTADADQAKGNLMGGVLQDDCDCVILDAASVAFVDSRGLEVMVDISDRLARSSSKLVVAGANETVREVLELTEISHLFEFSENVENALRSFE